MPGTSHSGGRNRKSQRQHALAGTGRKDRGTAKTATAIDAPDPPKGRPRPPRDLDGHALAEWTRMVDRLEAAQTLSTIDDAALYQYCCLFAETEGILDTRRTNAQLVTRLLTAVDTLDDDARVQAIAQIVQLKRLDAKYTTHLRQGHMALRQYLVEFGMTPAARSRVKVPETPPADPFAEFDAVGGAKH
jgi:P27 family predicted phage terminase small subunit